VSLEEIENKLVILGTEINNSNYFLHLAEILVNYYKNIFSKSKVKKILLNSGCRESSLDDMRVNLTDLPLSISDKKYLEFKDQNFSPLFQSDKTTYEFEVTPGVEMRK